MFKKISAIVLSFVLVALLTTTAFADTAKPPAKADAAPRRPAGGEITALAATGITFRTPKGEERNVLVSARTQYLDKDGNALTFADLEVGDRVLIAAAQRTGDVVTALWVRVAPPRTHYVGVGTVNTVEEDEFTFTNRRGHDWEFYVDADTQYTDRQGNPHTFAEVQPGVKVLVRAELRADGKWWATLVGLGRPQTQP